VSLTSTVPDEAGIVDTASGHICDYCGGALVDRALHWSGFGGEHYWHRDCFPEFVIRAFRDLHEDRCPAFYRRLRGQR
jgi:hypothetical protein